MQPEELSAFDQLAQPHLEPGKKYFKRFLRSNYGLSSRAWFEGDPRTDVKGEWSKDFEELLRPADRKIMDYIMKDASPGSIHFFIMEKGKPTEHWIPNIPEMEDLILRTLRAEMEQQDSGGFQILAHFLAETEGDDFPDHEYVSSKKQGETWETLSGLPYSSADEDLIFLRMLSGREPEKIMVEADPTGLRITSFPPIPEFGWDAVDESALRRGGKVEERKLAIEAARAQRMAFFQSLGQVEEMVFAPLIGPILTGGYNWPAGRPQYRVIHTDQTTVLITDGLSDPFEDAHNDPDLAYNGWTLEFYLEFPGKIPFDDFHQHYGPGILAQMSQTAIGHGGIEQLLHEHGIMSITFNGSALPPDYINENGTFGALLNVPSGAVPKSMALNLEDEVLLVSIKLVTTAQLAEIEAGGAEARLKLARRFQDEGSGAVNFV